MSPGDPVFLYCERGLNTALDAEPLNAVSNLAFILAAAFASRSWSRLPTSRRGLPEAALIALVALIGIGSTLFHTFATRLAMAADVIPVATFTLAYAVHALRRFLALTPSQIALTLALTAIATALASLIPCPNFAIGGNGTCLNGSATYLPALIALVALALAALKSNHAAARTLLAATAIFAVSLTLRTLDQQLCPLTTLLGAPRGTHALWHLLNAAMLALLLRATLDTGDPRRPAPTV